MNESSGVERTPLLPKPDREKGVLDCNPNSPSPVTITDALRENYGALNPRH